MLILSQKKDEIIVLENNTLIYLSGGIVQTSIETNLTILGYYTAVRAREVLRAIFDAYARGDRVYEMPEA